MTAEHRGAFDVDFEQIDLPERQRTLQRLSWEHTTACDSGHSTGCGRPQPELLDQPRHRLHLRPRRSTDVNDDDIAPPHRAAWHTTSRAPAKSSGAIHAWQGVSRQCTTSATQCLLWLLLVGPASSDRQLPLQHVHRCMLQLRQLLPDRSSHSPPCVVPSKHLLLHPSQCRPSQQLLLPLQLCSHSPPCVPPSRHLAIAPPLDTPCHSLRLCPRLCCHRPPCVPCRCQLALHELLHRTHLRPLQPCSLQLRTWSTAQPCSCSSASAGSPFIALSTCSWAPLCTIRDAPLPPLIAKLLRLCIAASCTLTAPG